jgi:hypothetical protein
LLRVYVSTRLQVLKCGHDITGKILKTRGIPISGGAAYTPFVVSQDRDATTDQKASEGNYGVAILRPGAMNKNDRRVFGAALGSNQRSGQPHVAALKTDVLVRFNLDAPRLARRRIPAAPLKRSDPPAVIPKERDAGFNRVREGNTRASEKAVGFCGV